MKLSFVSQGALSWDQVLTAIERKFNGLVSDLPDLIQVSGNLTPARAVKAAGGLFIQFTDGAVVGLHYNSTHYWVQEYLDFSWVTLTGNVAVAVPYRTDLSTGFAYSYMTAAHLATLGAWVTIVYTGANLAVATGNNASMERLTVAAQLPDGSNSRDGITASRVQICCGLNAWVVNIVTYAPNGITSPTLGANGRVIIPIAPVAGIAYDKLGQSLRPTFPVLVGTSDGQLWDCRQEILLAYGTYATDDAFVTSTGRRYSPVTRGLASYGVNAVLMEDV